MYRRAFVGWLRLCAKIWNHLGALRDFGVDWVMVEGLAEQEQELQLLRPHVTLAGSRHLQMLGAGVSVGRHRLPLTLALELLLSNPALNVVPRVGQNPNLRPGQRLDLVLDLDLDLDLGPVPVPDQDPTQHLNHLL
jgi:hypothetical protein